MKTLQNIKEGFFQNTNSGLKYHKLLNDYGFNVDGKPFQEHQVTLVDKDTVDINITAQDSMWGIIRVKTDESVIPIKIRQTKFNKDICRFIIDESPNLKSLSFLPLEIPHNSYNFTIRNSCTKYGVDLSSILTKSCNFPSIEACPISNFEFKGKLIDAEQSNYFAIRMTQESLDKTDFKTTNKLPYGNIELRDLDGEVAAKTINLKNVPKDKKVLVYTYPDEFGKIDYGFRALLVDISRSRFDRKKFEKYLCRVDLKGTVIYLRVSSDAEIKEMEEIIIRATKKNPKIDGLVEVGRVMIIYKSKE